MTVPKGKNRTGSEPWRAGARTAQHWRPVGSDGRVECTLSPRHCKLRDGQIGYCGVRRNIGGVLHTDNYGKAAAAAEEVVETEAIFHFRPGARILSLGNIGCMMSCKFCQNWTTSQVRHLDSRVVQTFTPDEVVALAEERGISVISWTYNDPVVWHEFVLETSRLAQRSGIRTLYKSALYIEAEPLAELIGVIDLFSISLKSLDPEYYRKIAHARLEPVLERIKEIHASGRHLEISQLIVTGLNDKESDIRETVAWHLANLGSDVPLHFVAFHPAFQYLDAERTPPQTLFMARRVAVDMGVRHVYLGNLYQNGVADTSCRKCGATLVRRFGLSVEVTGIDRQGNCIGCGAAAPIVEPHGERPPPDAHGNSEDYEFAQTVTWSSEINSVHVEIPDPSVELVPVLVEHGQGGSKQRFELGKGLGRGIVSRARDEERQITIRWNRYPGLRVLPVLDRAHLHTEID